MMLIVTQTLLRRLLQWTQCILFGVALSMLAYCGFVLVDTRIFQERERCLFERLLLDPQQTNGGTRKTASFTSPKTSPPGVTDGPIGRIEIPRLGISVIVIEGTSATTLRRAVGHISGTALPGQPGNVGISRHRDTFYRPLRNIQRNDVIRLTTLLGEYQYRVMSIKVVSPYEVGVLDPNENEILTLVTCYPFYFVGSAPDRFVVRAERVT